MSRSRRLFAAYGLTLLNQALIAVVGLFVTRYVLHRIGEQDYGLWIVGAQFLAYLGLLDLGVTALLPREVANITGKPTDEATRETELRALLGRSVSLVLLLVPPLTLAVAVIIAAIPATWAPLRWPLALSLGAFVVTYPLRVAHALLTGLQELTYLGWLQIVAWVINVGLTVLLVHFHFGIYAVALGPAFGQVASSIGWVARVITKHRRLLPRTFRWFDLSAVRAHLAPGGWVSLNQIAQLLLNNTDVVVIGRILGPAAINPYAFTDKLQTFFNNQPYAIALLAGPALTELKASGDKPRVAKAIGALSGVVLTASGGIAVVILATNHAFVRLWIGEQHFGGTALTAFLLANMLVRHWTYTYLNALFFFGHERACAILAIVDGCVSLGLTILCVRWFGLAGAALGPLISVLLTQLPACLWLLAREMGTSPTLLFASATPWFVRFVPIALIAGLVTVFFGWQSYLGVAALGAALGAVYAAAMLPILRRPPFGTYAAPILAKLGLARHPRATPD